MFAALGAGGEGRSGTDLLGLATMLATRGFDRNQESEADRFGLELLHQEYGHIAGTWDFFKRLPAPNTEFERDLVGYLSTHPVNSARIEALQALARKRQWPIEGEIRPFSR
jgi:predicted Zn-dependent protease